MLLALDRIVRGCCIVRASARILRAWRSLVIGSVSVDKIVVATLSPLSRLSQQFFVDRRSPQWRTEGRQDRLKAGQLAPSDSPELR